MERNGSRAVRRRAAGLVICVAVVCAAIIPNTPAMADSGDGSGPAAAAGVTPLLRLFDFGTAIGMPLACNLITSVITAGAQQVHAAKAVSPLITQLIDECNVLSQHGDKALQLAITQSQAMALINPVLNPVIAGMATGSHVVGSDNATTVAPFGPTIDGLGGTIAFFEGS